MFPEHFISLISDDIKEDHIRCCLIEEREKQNLLRAKLAVKRSIRSNRSKRDLLYRKAKRGQKGCVGLPNLLKGKATVNLLVADTYSFARKSSST